MPSPRYSNVTLTSSGGGVSVTIYLPAGVPPPEISPDVAERQHPTILPPYYESSRFEHGSMIGSIRIENAAEHEHEHMHEHEHRHEHEHGHGHGHKHENHRDGCEEDCTASCEDRHEGPRPAAEAAEWTKCCHHPPSQHEHVLYGTDLWRTPHDPHWTESGVGLASEFGYGDDGAYCGDADGGGGTSCGAWLSAPGSKVLNGVLGYEEAKAGGSFLKIGVGELVKGSCEACDPTDESEAGYKFNSPYEFVRRPTWTMIDEASSPDRLVLENEATLGHGYDDNDSNDEGGNETAPAPDAPLVGYRLRKEIALDGTGVLTVQTRLTNLGRDAFATPWYSHHFFTCDGLRVGPGYGVDLKLKQPGASSHHRGGSFKKNAVFEEPGVGSWSTPLLEYASVTARTSNSDHVFPHGVVEVELTKEVQEGTKIKADFPYDNGYTDGSFLLRGCGTAILEEIPELQQKKAKESQSSFGSDGGGGSDCGDLSMYAFNLYIERGTLSPEPLLLIRLPPGESLSWTQRIEFRHEDHHPSSSSAYDVERLSLLGTDERSTISHIYLYGLTLMILLSMIVVLILVKSRNQRARSRRHYLNIPDSGQRVNSRSP